MLLCFRMWKLIPLLITFAGLMHLSPSSLVAWAQDDFLPHAPVLLAVNRTDLGPSPSNAYRSQTRQQLANEIELTGELKRSSNNTWTIQANNRTYHIQNPEAWLHQTWFQEGTTIYLYGNLRPDIQHGLNTPVVMASHVFFVKVSPVKNQKNTIEQGINDQLTKENAQKYGRQIPFLKKLLDKIGW